MRKARVLLSFVLALTLLFTNPVNVFAAKNKTTTTPPAPTLSFSPTAPTNGNVTVTAYYPSTAVVKQYRLGLYGTWNTYLAPFIITSNVHVYVRYQISSGAWSALGGYNITNIDTVPPSNPVLTADTTAPTNGIVNVTVNYSADSNIKQYKLGAAGTWSAYSSPPAVGENTTVYARSQDIAGNWSNESSLVISNIDKTPPAAPTFSASNSKVTNQDVGVTINFSSDSHLRQYKLGSSDSWIDYTTSLTLSSNEIIFARASDAVGNWTPETSFEVSNIDKTPPMSPVFSASTTELTGQEVTLAITYSDDSELKQYMLGGSGAWNDYTGPLTINTNDTVYARASDIAGNWTPEISYTVGNIDRTPPDNPVITVSTSAPTNDSVAVSIEFSADSVVRQYMLGNTGIWLDYTSPVTLDENATIYAKASDSAGNRSSEVAYIVDNIDKTPPADPVMYPSSTQPTNQDISFTIDFSADSAVREYKIGSSGFWMDYSSPVTISSNTIIYARASDNAGNLTTETSYTIDNIDKEPPSAPVFSASTTQPTNQSVTVAISFSSDSARKQYRLASAGIWTDYSTPIILESNDTIYAKASDDIGNWTPESSFEVSNIDTTPPVPATFIASTTALTDLPVTVAINYSQDSAIKQYRIGSSGSWISYTAAIPLVTNTTVYAKSADEAGNWSSEASYAVTNIRKTVLGYTVKNYSTDKASYNSMVANVSVINEIATATYAIDGLGNLNGAAPTDQISYANSNGIRPKLMVSNNFDPNIAKQLLESPANRQNLKNNILNQLKANNYKGVDIDIENIPAANRSHFTTFMSEIYSTLKPLGYDVSVAVQPKTYDSPNAPWNYAFDYKALSEYSDYIMIMTYDEHYPGGTAGPIASISWVTSVVDYALTVIPKEKIVLGLAAYGYDWVGTTTKAYSVNGCYNLAAQYGATINFDNVKKSKYFNYTVNGVAHTVWFEDAETIASKLDLVNTRDLKGVGIWRLGLENTNYWTTIKTKLNK